MLAILLYKAGECLHLKQNTGIKSISQKQSKFKYTPTRFFVCLSVFVCLVFFAFIISIHSFATPRYSFFCA